MGAKHSKPRIRRNRRFSSTRKRQAPEGSNDHIPTPNETWNCGNNKAYTSGTKPVDESCKFCGVSEKCHNLSSEASNTKAGDDVIPRRIHSSDTRFLGDFLNQAALKVDIPRSPARCRNCVIAEKSRSLPAKAGMHDRLKSTTDKKDDEQEWTITLYEIDKMSGRVPREDMVRLMSSIYEAVDAKVGESSSQGRKTLRVRLSVTPERRKSQTKVHRTPSTPPRERSQCRCANCPNTEPSTRKTPGDDRLRRRESDVLPSRIPREQNSRTGNATISALRRPSRDHSGEDNDRTRHYAKLEGLDNTMYLHKRDNLIGTRNNERSKSLPQNRHRPSLKFDESEKPPGTNHRQRCNAGDHRTAKLRTRRKDPKFASPYDQQFQEAMYLRLRELQRQGAFEVRRATGRLQDGDEADDDSQSDVEFAKTTCDSDDRDAKPSGEYAPSNNKSRVVSTTSDASTPKKVSDQAVTSVHHHHHYHHGLPDASVLSALNSQDTLAVKCITSPTNFSSPSGIPKADDKSADHHRYHHHFHHADYS